MFVKICTLSNRVYNNNKKLKFCIFLLLLKSDCVHTSTQTQPLISASTAVECSNSDIFSMHKTSEKAIAVYSWNFICHIRHNLINTTGCQTDRTFHKNLFTKYTQNINSVKNAL